MLCLNKNKPSCNHFKKANELAQSLLDGTAIGHILTLVVIWAFSLHVSPRLNFLNSISLPCHINVWLGSMAGDVWLKENL